MDKRDQLLLGLDIGTTGTKCTLVNTDGVVLTDAYKAYPIYAEKPGWAEQRADDWWDAVISTVRQCTRDECVRRAVAAIGLSSQGGTLVPVSRDGVPLRRAILWLDGRGSSQNGLLKRNTAENYFYATTGWPLGNGLNAVNILWMKENEPGLFDQTFKFLTVVDYIAMKLTGEFCIDPSSAGIANMYNIKESAWDRKIMDLIGIREESLSKVIPSGTIIGELTDMARSELGLPDHVLVASGGHDQYCAALGAGVAHNGDVMLATGTAWVILGVSDKPMFDVRSLAAQSRHTVKGKWGSMLSLGNGGVCLDWFRNGFGSSIGGHGKAHPDDYADINRIVGQREPGAGGITFYPYFNGSSAPNWCSDNKGTVLGLELCHDKYDVYRAIMEGVAFQTAWMFESFQTGGFITETVKMLGGATKSRIWMQIAADVLNRAIISPSVNNPASVGAALLAGLAVNMFPSVEVGLATLSKDAVEIIPDRGNAQKYQVIFEQYKRQASQLQEIYSERRRTHPYADYR